MLMLLVLVILVPLLIGLSYAFRNINLLNPFAGGWIGLAHFRTLLADPVLALALRNTLVWTFASLALQFFLGLGLALLLAREFRGRKIFQALVFLPWAVPAFLSALNWAWLFNPVISPLPHWLAAVGVLNAAENILADPQLAMIGPIIANVWFGIPFFAITLLAALQTIPAELHEAAAIDGASARQRFIHITLPFLAPAIAITVLLRTIWIANFADLIFIMTGGGPANSTQIVATYIFTTAYRKLDFGYASAVATLLLALLLLYAMLLLRIRRQLLQL
jgi:multiple sugar transport system permease protein